MLPPAVVERRSDERELFALVNALRTGSANGPVWSSTAVPGLPSAVDMGALGAGVLQQTVTAGVATPDSYPVGTSRIPYGAGGGLITDASNYTINGTIYKAAQNEVQVFTATGSNAWAGFRAGGNASFTDVLAVLILGTTAAEPGLAARQSLIEHDGATVAMTLSNFAGGNIEFATGASRLVRMIVKGTPSGSDGARVTIAGGGLLVGEGTTESPAIINATATKSAAIQYWNKVAASTASASGNGVPGDVPSGDFVVSTFDGGWTEQLRVENTTGITSVVSLAAGGIVYAVAATGVLEIVTPEAGGAQTAGAAYGATEQGMLQTAYDALRTHGLLT